MKRNVVQNAASSSGNYEEEPTSEKTPRNRERPEVTKSTKMKKKKGKLASKLTERDMQRGLVW